MSDDEKRSVARIVHEWRGSYEVKGGIDAWLERGLGHPPTQEEHDYALECIDLELRRGGVIK